MDTIFARKIKGEDEFLFRDVTASRSGSGTRTLVSSRPAARRGRQASR
jgi:hypothetical protein